MVGFGPISPGEETLLGPTQVDAQHVAPRLRHWFSIAVRRNIGMSWQRRTLTSCLPAPSLNRSRLVRNRSGTTRARRSSEPAMRRSS